METRKERYFIVSAILALIILTILTRYYGSTDIGDYSDIAKYFAGDFSAKIRSSHSYLYGAMHFPFVALFRSLFIFKISSLLFLLLLIYSVYTASGRNKKALWLMLLSPLVWYMSPWINPIQLSSLFFFWSYYFIRKYEMMKDLKFLIFSGVLAGLSFVFWDAMLFFIIIFAFCFFFNKKVYLSLIFLSAVLVGLLPKLLFDQYFLGFAFSGILRYFSGVISASLYQGIYGTMGSPNLFLRLITLLIFLPLFTYSFFSKEKRKDIKSLLFISLSLLLILKNMQIRYILLLTPILIYELAPIITQKQFKIQIFLSFILIVLVEVPYVIQMQYSTNAEEFSAMLDNINKIKIYENSQSAIISDINAIAQDYPDSVFVVGNAPDNYQYLAHLYWGKDVKEFVSIQDYNLFFSKKTALFEKKFMPVPRIRDRRQIWISGGISKNENDNTDYNSINLGISLEEPINLTGFEFVKKYNLLYLSRKSIS